MSSKLKAGDWVEVRSKEEILKTLDRKGQMEGLPFMPQMFQYCGKRFKVWKRAHKTCDTVFPVRGRRMADAVHLETRCTGLGYGDCQAGCLIFWKNAWLKTVKDENDKSEPPQKNIPIPGVAGEQNAGCTEQDVWAGTLAPGQQNELDPAYVCQATQLPYATTKLSWWDIRQYIEDYISGNVGLWQILKGGIYAGYYKLSVSCAGLGSAMRWFYDKFHPLWNGTLFPRHTGTIPVDKPTPVPTHPLNLQPGELVRVKSHEEILKTLSTINKNRGLYFDAEMVPFCGGTYRVLKRVNKILDEKTGKMTRMKNEAIILEGVFCQSRYSNCRMFCPRAIYPYWREIWLERISTSPAATQSDTSKSVH
ncbi:MAG: hypothetical protein WBN22_03840 [Verrucomicrobiia bacterium]